MADPVRVSIIGGGCAGLTAAFELTRPELHGRYAVTVYQMGWRLGGKGASGRGPADRIEEHGLHLWMGFYENAFRLMRACYAELPARRGRRFRQWTDAFTPAPHVGVADTTGDGGWEFWVAHFQGQSGLPGDPIAPGDGPYTVTGYLRQVVILLRELLRSAKEEKPGPGADGGGGGAGGVPSAETAIRFAELAAVGALYEATDFVSQAVATWTPELFSDRVQTIPRRLVEAVADAAHRRLAEITACDTPLRRTWHVIDLMLAIVRGATAHGLALDPRGFDAINDYDWREWLRMHGASEASLNSGFLRGIYDLVFAYEDGDVTRPRLAAGVALRGAMRMFFGYRGSLFWRMNAGMGDVVFAPLYEVLRARGVKFEFFHRLRNVGLARTRKGERPWVRDLTFDVQARARDVAGYDPLVDVRGVPSWPAEPVWSRLANGAALRRRKPMFEWPWERQRVATRTVRAGSDFDFVVLAVGGGAVAHVTPELVARVPRWAAMVRHLKTVPTQTVQLWLNEDLRTLGWAWPPTHVSGFAPPFDTWADMSHLIPVEGDAGRVKAVLYACGVLPDAHRSPPTAATVRAARAEVRERAIAFLEGHAATFWPGVRGPRGDFRWGLLEPPRGTSSATQRAKSRGARASLETQYHAANLNPTDRYVLALPGSIQYRLSPLDVVVDNLTVAGDWTATGLDSGCVESAVMSGMLAAHALSQQPPLERIVGYDHP